MVRMWCTEGELVEELRWLEGEGEEEAEEPEEEEEEATGDSKDEGDNSELTDIFR